MQANTYGDSYRPSTIRRAELRISQGKLLSCWSSAQAADIEYTFLAPNRYSKLAFISTQTDWRLLHLLLYATEQGFHEMPLRP